VLTVALFTAFMIACNVPLEDTSVEIVKEAKEKPVVPKGKIKVRLSLADSGLGARTVYPTGTGAYVRASDFPFFLLKVYNGATDVTPNAAPFNTYFIYSDFDTTLVLDGDAGTSGHYYFAVIACDSDHAPISPAPVPVYLAFGSREWVIEADNVTEDPNDDLPDVIPNVTITLSQIVGDVPSKFSTFNGNGKFAWNLDVDAYETATLILASPVTPTAGIANFNPLNLKTTPVNTVGESVLSGYYMITVELGKTGGYQTQYVREIVHIYSGFTSTYADALPALRSTTHTINFNYDGATGLPGSKTITHGARYEDVFIKTTNNKTPAHSTPNDYYFDGWFYDSSFAQPLDYNDDDSPGVFIYPEKVLKSGTLYVQWGLNDTPQTSDFNVINLSQTYTGSPATAVSISPKSLKSQGAITGIAYNGNGTAPTNAGTYPVTFDIALDPVNHWKGMIGLSAGSLVIDPATPVAGDYDIANTGVQPYENVTAVTVSPKTGKSTGARTIYYTGINGTSYGKSQTLPTASGDYQVTFDVAAVSPNWNGATGLTAGTLTIDEPVLSFFRIGLHWKSAGAPAEFADSSVVSYDRIQKELTIYIEVENYTDSGDTFAWYVGFGANPLSSSTRILSDVLPIDLDDEDDLNWLLGTNHDFTVVINGNLTGVITLTRQ